MRDLRLPVWQFVRLMVQVEETLKKGRSGPVAGLSRAWGEVWEEVDGALGRLGKTDPEAFADLMMDQEVVLEQVTADQVATAGQEFAKVIATMRERLKRQPKAGQEAEDLRFEIDALEATVKALPRV